MFAYETITLSIHCCGVVLAACRPKTFSNPIIPGFNPDPSICRAGHDYYVITSSFEYFPGIPIYHSTDLVNWTLIGHVLTRLSQIDLEGLPPSEGIYAPTIRYHDGTFYVVVSLLKRNPRRVTNLLFTADNSMRYWSDPIVLTDSSLWGIDPSLFFDDDGTCYFTANRKHQVEQPYSSYREIALQQLDLRTMKLVGPIDVIGQGAVVGAATAEGPHLYKKDGRYYLLISEGGTRTNHAVTISRSRDIRGPYEPCPYNPILTHRHLQETVSLRNLGHADMVQTQDHQWWMVCLGVRFTDQWSLMGRETFLVPMIWPEQAFPVINPGKGLVQRQYPLPRIAQRGNDLLKPFIDDFKEASLRPEWTFLRNDPNGYALTPDHKLKIELKPVTVSQYASPAFLGKRIENADFEATAKLSFQTGLESEEAGLILLSDHRNHIRLTLTRDRLQVIETRDTIKTTHAFLDVMSQGDLYLRVRSDKQRLSFYVAGDGIKWRCLAQDINSACLGRYKYTGNFVALYGTSNGQATTNSFVVDWFKYQNR